MIYKIELFINKLMKFNMSVSVPILCACGQCVDRCMKCSSPLRSCRNHSDMDVCNICEQTWKCTTCNRTSISCIRCNSVVGSCRMHQDSMGLCLNCYKAMKCPQGADCIRAQCRSCEIYLDTCMDHNRQNGLCSKCFPYKCRIEGCHQLVGRCRGIYRGWYKTCKELLPVCPDHGTKCHSCNINDKLFELRDSIKVDQRCCNCYTPTVLHDVNTGEHCEDQYCKNIGKSYCLPCSKAFLIPTRRDKLRCYPCVLGRRKVFKRELHRNLRQRIINDSTLYRDVAGIVADYLLDAEPVLSNVTLPDHWDTRPSYYNQCDTKTPVPPVPSVTRPYGYTGHLYNNHHCMIASNWDGIGRIDQIMGRAQRYVSHTVFDFALLYPTLSLYSVHHMPLVNRRVYHTDIPTIMAPTAIPMLMPPANTNTDEMD